MFGPTSESTLRRSHGVRPTPQRVAVLAALRGVTSHPTAEELHGILDRLDRSMSLTTVYNALQALGDAGLCRKIATTGHSSRYDAGTHEHVHLRDSETGEIVDVPSALSERLLAQVPPALLAEIGERLGVEVDRVSIQLVGRRPAGER